MTNVLVLEADRTEPLVTASFSDHLYDVRNERTPAYFGRYEYRLRREGAGWMVAAKKIFLLNDVIPTVIDFYTL